MFGLYSSEGTLKTSARPVGDVIAALERTGLAVTAPWRGWRGRRVNAPVWRRRTRRGYVFTNKREDVASGTEFLRPYAAAIVQVSAGGEGTTVSVRFRAARLIPVLRFLATSPFLVGAFIWVGQWAELLAWMASVISASIFVILGRDTRQGERWYRQRAHQLERALAPALFDGGTSADADDLGSWMPDPPPA